MTLTDLASHEVVLRFVSARSVDGPRGMQALISSLADTLSGISCAEDDHHDRDT